MKGILDCARCPMSVLPIFNVCRRHLLICPDVAVHMTLLNSTYLSEGDRVRMVDPTEVMHPTYDALLKVEYSTGGDKNA